MKVKLSQVTLDASTQSRSKVDQNTVERYTQLIALGKSFPPLVVFGETNILADGWHRYHAYKKAGIIDVEIHRMDGDRRDAEFYALSANNEHGLPMDMEDCRRNARRLLTDPEWCKISDRKIAELVGLSDTTVLRIRRALEDEGKIEPKTSNRIKSASEKQAASEKQESASEKQTVSSEPDESRPEDLQQIKELSDVVSELSEENQKLRDIVAIGAWDATDIEKEDIEETVKELREKIVMLEREINALRVSRDTYMNEVVELQRINKSLRNQLKKQ